MQRLQQSGIQRLVTHFLARSVAPAALLQEISCLRYIDDSRPQSTQFPTHYATFTYRCYMTPAAFKASVLNAKPQSLAVPNIEEFVDDAEIGAVKRFLLKIGGFYSKESSHIRGAKNLYEGIVRQSEDKDLKQAIGLPDKFSSTYSLLCLHVWMVLVRLRLEKADGKDLAQAMYEDFTDDVELRVHAEGVKVRVQKWLKELEKMFYGSCESYEKALKGEGTLADALLRNVYGDNVAQRGCATALAKYVERELACLNITPSKEMMAGRIQWSYFHIPQDFAAKPGTPRGSPQR